VSLRPWRTTPDRGVGRTKDDTAGREVYPTEPPAGREVGGILLPETPTETPTEPPAREEPATPDTAGADE